MRSQPCIHRWEHAPHIWQTYHARGIPGSEPSHEAAQTGGSNNQPKEVSSSVWLAAARVVGTQIHSVIHTERAAAHARCMGGKARRRGDGYAQKVVDSLARETSARQRQMKPEKASRPASGRRLASETRRPKEEKKLRKGAGEIQCSTPASGPAQRPTVLADTLTHRTRIAHVRV